MIRTLFSFLPCAVSLGWFVVFALTFRRNDKAKRVLTIFLAACAILYGCHYIYFTQGSLSHPLECLWTLMSLLSYPLFFIYLCLLTASRVHRGVLWGILLPSILVAGIKSMAPSAEIDTLQKILFASQVIGVLHFGNRRLEAFDRELHEFYADTEGRSTAPIRYLLLALVCSAFASTIINLLGRPYFERSTWILAVPSVIFSSLIFAASLIGYRRHFSVEQYHIDTQDIPATTPEPSEECDEECVITQLIEERQLYLNKDFTLSDVVRLTGYSRTFVSNYINAQTHQSFSDYINHLRIEHAKQLMMQNQNEKLQAIALRAGFSTEQTFYRNFRKFNGKTPAAWLQQGRTTNDNNGL